MAKQELGWWMVGAGTEWYDQSGGGEQGRDGETQNNNTQIRVTWSWHAAMGLEQARCKLLLAHHPSRTGP